MHVWNVLHTARWKFRMQQVAKKSPSGHNRTILSGYIFATKACIDNRKQNLLDSNITSTCSYKMANFGPLTAEINGFRVLASLLALCDFDMRRLRRTLTYLLNYLLTAATSLTGGQPNFARCLAVPWAGTLYTFSEAFAPDGILPRAKFTFRRSLTFFYIDSVTVQHSSSGRQPNFAAFSSGRHLYTAERPSRWTLAHIFSLCR